MQVIQAQAVGEGRIQINRNPCSRWGVPAGFLVAELARGQPRATQPLIGESLRRNLRR